jgi:hypothetical protein
MTQAELVARVLDQASRHGWDQATIRRHFVLLARAHPATCRSLSDTVAQDHAVREYCACMQRTAVG